MIPVKNSDKDSYRGERELNPFRQILTQCDGRQIDMVVSGTDQRPILIGDQHPSGMFDGDLRWADPDLYAKRCSAHQAFHSPQVLDADRRKAAVEGQYLSARQLPPTNWKIWIGIIAERDG